MFFLLSPYDANTFPSSQTKAPARLSNLDLEHPNSRGLGIRALPLLFLDTFEVVLLSFLSSAKLPSRISGFHSEYVLLGAKK